MVRSGAVAVLQPANTLGIQEQFAKCGNKRVRTGDESTGLAPETQHAHKLGTPRQAAPAKVPSNRKAQPAVENKTKKWRQISQPQQPATQGIQGRDPNLAKAFPAKEEVQAPVHDPYEEAQQQALKAEEAQVASTEQQAAQLWDDGQPDAAEQMLRDASSVASLSSSGKVVLLLRLLEYCVQQLAVDSCPAREEACEQLVYDLSAVSQRPDCTKSNCPILQRRFYFWLGQFYLLLGKHTDAAYKFCQAAGAAKRGGGHLARCLGNAAIAYYAHAKALERAGRADEALEAAMRCLERAHEAGSRQYTVWSSVMGAGLHCKRAVQLSRPREYLPALQLLVLGLKQTLQGIPTEVAVVTVEHMLRQCGCVLECTKALYMLSPSAPPPAFVPEVERVMHKALMIVYKARGLDGNALAFSSQPIQAQLAALHQPISVRMAPPPAVKAEPQTHPSPVKQEPLEAAIPIKAEPSDSTVPVKCEPLSELQSFELQFPIKTEPAESCTHVKVDPVQVKAEPCT